MKVGFFEFFKIFFLDREIEQVSLRSFSRGCRKQENAGEKAFSKRNIRKLRENSGVMKYKKKLKEKVEM